MKYYVTIVYDASTTIEVDAESPEEAKDRAMEQASSVSLCHQCAKYLEVGDPVEALHPHTDSTPGERS